MAEVTIYTTPTCPWCSKTKQFLKDHDVGFREVDVTADESTVAELKQVSGQLGVPVIKAGELVIVGFDQPKLQELVQAQTGK